MAQQDLAERFIDALAQLEQDREVEPLVALHAEGSDVGNVNAPERFHGPDGARRFWTEYRSSFGDMRSEFRNIIATDGRVALEWATTGTAVDGKPIEYEGVSILEFDSDKVARFRAYFDSGKLGRQMAGQGVA